MTLDIVHVVTESGIAAWYMYFKQIDIYGNQNHNIIFFQFIY